MVSRPHMALSEFDSDPDPLREGVARLESRSTAGPGELMAAFEQTLAELRRRTELDPFANPILLLAHRNRTTARCRRADPTTTWSN